MKILTRYGVLFFEESILKGDAAGVNVIRKSFFKSANEIKKDPQIFP